jgi:hypothetical protein
VLQTARDWLRGAGVFDSSMFLEKKLMGEMSLFREVDAHKARFGAGEIYALLQSE